MECNKEEAIRAKEIAEQKMEAKDYTGARKIAMKAQQLYPDLDNIAQLIMVCDVHCSAEKKVFGADKDWYAILKVPSTADESLIKKQFRKFALILHPDKNKFFGASDAFKLIGEAQRVLLDGEKRKIFDIKYKSAAPPNGAPRPQTQPFTRTSIFRKPPGSQSNNFGKNVPPHQQPAAQKQEGQPTFWTVCPYCLSRFQYYRDVINRLLECQSCKKNFTGYEVGAQPQAPQGTPTRPAFPKQEATRNTGQPSKVPPHSNFVNSTMKAGFKGKSGSGKATNLYANMGPTSEVGQGSDSKPNRKYGERESAKSLPCESVSGKKRKKIAESSESCDSESSTGSEEEEINIEERGFYNEQCPRRSGRSKRNVSYTENLNDEDLSSKTEPQNMNRSEGVHDNMEVDENDGIHKESSGEKEEVMEDCKGEPETYEYPDPDFSDFDRNREEKCFKVGQIWAVYDTVDAMPRFYARIKKVVGPKFKLQITWLEPDPDDEDEIKWVEEDLPVSCGKFKLGSSEYSDDHPMFSHLVCWEKGKGRNTYKVYPRKGETWALFKDWDMNWKSDLENKRKYEYEFVEVLSDYADGVAIPVAFLGKVKGYACLFCRINRDGAEIASKELFRFSHRVPSCQMTGEERTGVLEGSFELDPACLPNNLEEIDIPTNEETEAQKMHPNGSFSETILKSYPESCINQEEQNTQSDSQVEAYDVPDPEFYNFDGDKSIDKFKVGQIWALYCDEDGLPKYYGQITNIGHDPEFKMDIAWLGVGSMPKDMIQWADKEMPVVCGRFRFRKVKRMQYDSNAPFSHQVRAKLTVKDYEFDIFPGKGEVWALYKDWNAGIKCSDLEKWDYEMVEVLEDNDSMISVLLLDRVDGFKSVFKPRMNGESALRITIPKTELLRFSHQIPAFWLTDEKDGGLKGCLELDPAALPVHWFSSS